MKLVEKKVAIYESGAKVTTYVSKYNPVEKTAMRLKRLMEATKRTHQ